MNGACALCSYSGFHARSLNWQRRTQARDRTSDGQPENIVGRFRKIETTFKHSELKYACVGAAAGFDLDLDIHLKKSESKDRSLRQLLQ